MILDVHPGSGFFHHRIPDPQHWMQRPISPPYYLSFLFSIVANPPYY